MRKKGREKVFICAAISLVCAAYRELDMLHHGEFTSCSLEYAYYTRNTGFPQYNLVAIKLNNQAGLMLPWNAIS